MKYAWLQYKKLLKILPFVILIALVLLGLVGMVLNQFSAVFRQEQESRFKVAVAGNTNGPLFRFGLVALQTLDHSRFSVDLELTDEQTAREELLTGQISAYVVIPSGFMKAAEQGQIIPITYCTTASAVDLSALMRDEITDVVSVLWKESQKGVFGTETLLRENGYETIAEEEADRLNLQYIQFIVDRTHMYQTQITGVSYGLDLTQHLLIGHAVIWLFVLTIPLICPLVRQDNSLPRRLCACGKGPVYSAVSEYAALLAALLSVLCVSGAAVWLAGRLFGSFGWVETSVPLRDVIWLLVPVAALIAAFAFLVEEASGNLLSAVTGLFFLALALCYVSGCMYPLYALPESLQKLARLTPAGVARECLSLALTGRGTGRTVGVAVVETAVCIAAAVRIRACRMRKGEG